MTTQDPAIAISRSAARRVLWAIGIIVALVILALLPVFVARQLAGSDPLASAINSHEYQAVFLANGQVYFGHLTAPGGEFYYLRHVYYLSSGKSGSKINKLTNDLHAPEDLVVVNRRQILYVENLRPSGRVSKLMNQGGP